MNRVGWIAMCIIGCCLQPALSSYLGYPRIHFAGQFRSDCNTRNNDNCNYRYDKPFNPDLNGVDWNANGTNEFQFVGVKVTSVVYEDGTVSTSDTLVGRPIVGNLERPIAKLCDISPNSGEHSTIYGMKFGVTWSDGQPAGSDDVAFYGNWRRSILGQFVWTPMKCYNKTHHGTQLYQDSLGQAGQGTTLITNLRWGKSGNSAVLSQLREMVGSGDISVRVSTSYHTENYPPYVAHNATLGYVIGVIGAPSESDTLNVPGERGMFPKNTPIGVTRNLPSDDLCYNQNADDFDSWTQFAPFEVDTTRNEVRLDLSNSLPTNLAHSVRDIGTLRIGVVMDSCVHLLGNESGLPYASSDELPVTSGIYTVPMDASLADTIATNPLAVVQVLESDEGTSTICGEGILSSVETKHTAQVILEEYPYFIRPKGYYAEFLDRNFAPNGSQTVYATKYGKRLAGMQINLVQSTANGPPENGIVPADWAATTDENGLATFGFEINKDVLIPPERHYATPPCSDAPSSTTLPIDGQVYFFYYCVDVAEVNCSDYTYIRSYYIAFSDMNYTREYTWVKDVNPILTQYARISPIMKAVLDMSSYGNVTQNIGLLNLTLRLDFDDPSHMPTTRDLSPTKRAMILEWLENPIYDDKGTVPVEETPLCIPPTLSAAVSSAAEYFLPNRCRAEKLGFADHPNKHDPYFHHILSRANDDEAVRSEGDGEDGDDTPIPGRPLANFENCSVENARIQLQTAVQLEWATIPVYLTSLYSIVDGCNTEIYQLIRSVAMQEMLHFTQSANILIALGGSPLIDDASMTPSFPTTGLPGGVLSSLRVTLEKLSLQHVYDVFMGIEIPNLSIVDLDNPVINNLSTIGVFYEEIQDCINELGDGVFNSSTLDSQVKWPWPPPAVQGDVVPVNDTASAQKGINMIMEQGEGAGIINPYESLDSETLSHFYKFEEIVCQKHLEPVKNDSLFYSYSGDPIPFSSAGVWPMRPNPKASTLIPNSNCYNEARIFNQVYRMLLLKLQEVFNGSPEDIFVAVELMESLQVHAKKLMYIKHDPDDPNEITTCGPVWDYNF